MTKGLIYYSDCRGDQGVLSAVRCQIVDAAPSVSVVSVTLAPVDLGANIVLPLERGYLTMFRQILTALEAIDADVVFHCEHDVLYHRSHFDFVPPRMDTFYYNQHVWRVNAETGQAVFYYCNQVSGLCASRALLLEHYRQVVAHVEAHGFDRSIGFEPGANRRQQALFGVHPVETWMSAGCNVDIKTGHCLTKWRGSPDQFRNKSTCQGWTEADAVPGWGVTKGRVPAFLAELGAREQVQA